MPKTIGILGGIKRIIRHRILMLIVEGLRLLGYKATLPEESIAYDITRLAIEINLLKLTFWRMLLGENNKKGYHA